MAAAQGAESLPTISRCVPWPAEHTPAGSDWWTVVWSDQWASSSPSIAKLTVYTHLVFPGPDSRWVSKSLYSGLFCLIKRLISLLNHLSAFCAGSDQLRFVCLFLKCTFLFCVLFHWTLYSLNRGKYQIFKVRNHTYVHVTPLWTIPDMMMSPARLCLIWVVLTVMFLFTWAESDNVTVRAGPVDADTSSDIIMLIDGVTCHLHRF